MQLNIGEDSDFAANTSKPDFLILCQDLFKACDSKISSKYIYMAQLYTAGKPTGRYPRITKTRSEMVETGVLQRG